MKSPDRNRPAPIELDAIDRRILDALQEDNQVTNLALAERVGLSPPACLKRVRRLRQERVVVRDVALVDPERVGQTIVAFVGVELDRQREDVLAAGCPAQLSDGGWCSACRRCHGQDGRHRRGAGRRRAAASW